MSPSATPTRPGLSLTSCQLIRTALTAGASRVAPDPLYLHAVATTPAGPMETHSLLPSHQLRPSPNLRRVGSCVALFGACVAFTRVTACMLAESPKATLCTRGFSSLVASTTALVATGWSEPVPGWGFHPLWISAFSRRTEKLGLGLPRAENNEMAAGTEHVSRRGRKLSGRGGKRPGAGRKPHATLLHRAYRSLDRQLQDGL